MKDYLKLPPEKAIPTMREELHAFLDHQSSGRVYNPDGTKIPNEMFMLAHMVEYLLEVVGHLQERLGS